MCRFLALLALLCVSVAGCNRGPARADVSGQVTYNGKPLDKPGGTISFFGIDGIAVRAPIDTSGNYRAIGVCVGENRVAVAYQRPAPIAKHRANPSKGDAEKLTAQVDSPFLTPEAYARPETSDLKVVVEGSTTYSPKLTGPEIQ